MTHPQSQNQRFLTHPKACFSVILKMLIQDYIPVFEGKVAVLSFLLSVSMVAIVNHITIPVLVMLQLIYMLVLTGLWKFVKLSRFILLSHVVGLIFGIGMAITCNNTDSVQMVYLGVYMMVLAFFHISEFVATSIHNPQTLSLSSFLLNHSMEYGIAAVASWIEYSVELFFIPWLKSYWFICAIGLILVIGGEFLRKLAMFTAMTNFTHNVQYYKRYNHQLITYGVYRYFRHPSYVGWFYWSTGTQLILCNPVCLVVYIATVWHFFKDRIETEEELLIHFFGQEYLDYKSRVGTGLPFIRGYTGQLPPDLVLLKSNSRPTN